MVGMSFKFCFQISQAQNQFFVKGPNNHYYTEKLLLIKSLKV